MKTLKKKIVKAHDKYEFHKLIEEHKHRGWKMLSEIKMFKGYYPFEVLMGLELEVNK